jgi:hypothetical protein
VPDGALSCANDGSAIGEGDAVGELVGVCVGVAVADALGDVATFRSVVHAVRTRTRRSSARIHASLSGLAVSCL